MGPMGVPELIIMLIVALLALSIPAALVFVLLLSYRRRGLEHRERMAAIDRGVPLPEAAVGSSERAIRTYLLRGMIWLFAGIALSIFLLGLSLTSRVPAGGFIFAQAQAPPPGIEGNVVHPEQPADTEYEYMVPLGFSLLGLVPAAVGVAYLVFYRVESNRGK